MADLVVIVPSRGRPQAARELAKAFATTCAADTRLVFAVDEDDPSLEQYQDAVLDASPAGRERLMLYTGASTSMVEALNCAAQGLTVELFRELGEAEPFAIGFMGDDHRPRTKGWDQAYLEALRELATGIVYGNDLLQGERIPTQVAITSDIIRAIGHMAPPTLRHLYVDDYWKQLGERAGCLKYLPDVVVEHMHPVAGKAQWDDGYKRVNDQRMYNADARAFEAYAASGKLAADVRAVKALKSGVAA